MFFVVYMKSSLVPVALNSAPSLTCPQNYTAFIYSLRKRDQEARLNKLRQSGELNGGSPPEKQAAICSGKMTNNQDIQEGAWNTVDSTVPKGEVESCDTCRNSGFVPCKDCNSLGYVRREGQTNVFYCMSCVGHGKVRCPSCGGKCYMCDSA